MSFRFLIPLERVTQSSANNVRAARVVLQYAGFSYMGWQLHIRALVIVVKWLPGLGFLPDPSRPALVMSLELPRTPPV